MLITGHKGFIGRNLTNYLDRKKVKYHTFAPKPYEYNCSTLIHLSASTNIRRSLADPLNCFQGSCAQTVQMLDFARLNGFKKFIFASSGSAADPKSPYAAAKAASESFCKAYSESYGLEISIVRFSNVYGPYSQYKKGLISNYIKACLAKQPFTLFGLGTQTRDFIYVEDLVPNLINSPLGTTTLSTGISTTINEVVEMLYDIAISYGYNPQPILHKPANKGEISSIEMPSDYPTQMPLSEGLIRTFKWFIHNLNDL